MLKLVIIADDITGAADTGVQFRNCLGPIYLVDHRSLPVGTFEPAAHALSVFTSTRGATAAEARRSVSSAIRAISDLRPQQIYKKIDSALRGPIGAELEAVMTGLDIPMSFIVPAFPGQGRTTVAGIHRIHGVPVAETEMGRDLVSAVTESCLPKWIGRQTEWAVAHIGLETVEAGSETMADAIENRLARGARHFTFDALHAVHLERIVDVAQGRFRNVLLCGAAGLAQSWAKRLSPPGGPEAAGNEKTPMRIEGRLLWVCGSASDTLRRQVEELVHRAPVADQVLDPLALVQAGSAGFRAADALQRAVTTLAASDLVLRPAPPLKEGPLIESGRLVTKFAEFAGAVISRSKPAGLFLSGGDTALAVLAELKVQAVRLEREITSGAVGGIILGGTMSGRPVVTKAGSFGNRQVLLELHHALRGGGGPSRRLSNQSDTP